MNTKEKGPAGGQAQKTELNSCSKVAVPAETASPFTPDLLVIAAVIARARRHERTPPAMIVWPDGSEAPL